jgi:putative phosphoesterase
MRKIGLISDPHACAAPVREALAIFQHEDVDEIWCTGDIAGYGNELAETVKLLKESGCKAILGNHEIWYLEKTGNQPDTLISEYINSMPAVIHEDIEGVRVYMVHASPPDSMEDGIRLLDQHGAIVESARLEWQERLSGFAYDILIIGHTHQVYAEKLGDVLVINPGSSCYNHSCAVLILPQMELQWHALSGKPIQQSWNWAKEVRI